MQRSSYFVAALATCLGCTQSQTTDLTAAPSAATALAVAETEATPELADAEPTPAAALPQSADPAPAVELKPATSKARTAAKPVMAAYSSNVPAVHMSAAECADCAVTIGDQMPQFKLPRLEGGEAELASLAGAQATVVVFWGADRWMSHAALSDLQNDAAASQRTGVAVVGIAVGITADAARAAVEKSGARFTQLTDADGTALAQLGGAELPRVYVIDAAGKIAWFDIEYSEASRRELHATLAALTSGKP